MSIISTLKEQINSSDVDFPKIMRSGRLIILFSLYGEGVVISGDSDYRVGYRSTSWSTNEFKDYNDEVTLKNVQN